MPILEDDHPAIPAAPNDDATIWRFMSLSKFLALLGSSALYFPQLSKLMSADPFEGRFTQANRAVAERLSTDKQYSDALLGKAKNENEEKARAFMLSPDFLNYSERASQLTHYVSCWHINEHESAGLWSIYANQTEGVAIKTTIKKLKQALSRFEKNVFLGRVQYLDYGKSVIGLDNAFRTVFSKRMSFQHEAELRACIVNHPEIPEGEALISHLHKNPAGFEAPCDVAELIDTVFVPPLGPSWLKPSIETVCHNFGYSWPVHRSSILDGDLL